MSKITDKVVVITAASSGIGESTAKLLAEHGAKVVLGARRSNRIDAVVQEISANGRRERQSHRLRNRTAGPGGSR